MRIHQFQTTTKKEPTRNKNKRLTFWLSLRKCPFESELVLVDPDKKGEHKKEQHEGRLEIRNTPGADWMVGKAYYIRTKHVDRPLWMTIFFFRLYDRSIEAEALCKLRNRLLVAAGGSLRFGCQHHAPHRIRSRGHFQDSRRQQENTRSKYTCRKNDISKPAVDG